VRRGVFVGLSTVDLIHTVDELPQANSKSVATSQQVFVGGPATNASITFRHLGGSATLVAAVGCHPLSILVKSELERYSVDLLDLTPNPEVLPPVSSVWVNRRGERSVVSMNATHFKISAPEIDNSLLESTSVVLVDAHCMEACLAWASAARKRLITVVLDGGSWKSGTDELLTLVDTAICSDDFLPPGCTNEECVIDYLRSAGVRQVAITRGSSPIRFVEKSHAGLIHVPQIHVVDSLGAGDIFHGAFCFYVSAGCAFADALRIASRVATESCRFMGTREWMSRT
jgi:sugar/nucleoside kinase (ribokinase family)